MTIETTTMTELPAMPPPNFEPIYLVVSYYAGPGWASRRWKVHKQEWPTWVAAQIAADKLARWHIHRRIVRIG